MVDGRPAHPRVYRVHAGRRGVGRAKTQGIGRAGLVIGRLAGAWFEGGDLSGGGRPPRGR